MEPKKISEKDKDFLVVTLPKFPSEISKMQSSINKKIKSGKIFIYPTDTVYGLGCDAGNSKAVAKIKEIKDRDSDKPLSVIAPSIDWIKENCVVDYDLEKYLPGPYTLILKKKDPSFLLDVASGDTIGVRIPKSEFCDIVREVGRPFVTTSVNLSGEDPAVSIEDIDLEIIERVDEIIDEGKLDGKPSTLIINGEEVKRG
jgi:L-threonylcarbamoyladenylate synthase